MERQRFVFQASDLGALFEALKRRGYRVVGPRLHDGAIVYDELHGPADLPVGWVDVQEPGRYRLVRREEDDACFAYGVGPQSWKRFLNPPRITLFRAARDERGFRLLPDPDEPAPRYAFLGVRACELGALARQDRVFLGSASGDPTYRARRSAAFVVAVNCGQSGGTCFCASMGTGPGATSGFDLLLTELVVFGRHDFVMQTGSERGGEVAAEVPHRPASAEDMLAVEALLRRAVETQGRSMDAGGVKDLLYRHYQDPHWDEVATRCLACGNCTLVCPTCFCSTIEDTTDLSGSTAERTRLWDSCFTLDFSYVHGGSVRTSAGARYRQWITHKLATWHEQFGSSGCVGCGRCITWCPVGIDLTQEVSALRRSEGGKSDASPGV